MLGIWGSDIIDIEPAFGLPHSRGLTDELEVYGFIGETDGLDIGVSDFRVVFGSNS